RLCWQLGTRRGVRGAARVQEDRPAYRPQGLGDDSADGECLLPVGDERHQLSGRDFAASVLWKADGRRGELWRDRSRDWTCTYAWLRRSGTQIRCPGKFARLVDGGRR